MQSLITQSSLEIIDNLRGRNYRFKKQRPYMKFREQEILEEVLIKLKPHNCLEWGSGHSTLYFPKLLPSDAQWISVENDSEWYERIKRINTQDKTKLFHVNMPHFPVERDDIEGDFYQDTQNYLNLPDQFAPFDFILIDGRSRVKCLEKAIEIIKDDGIIVLHDANRKYYQRNVPSLKYQALFTDFRRNAGGVWLGSKNLPIENIISLNSHLKKWAMLRNKFAKVLNL